MTDSQIGDRVPGADALAAPIGLPATIEAGSADLASTLTGPPVEIKMKKRQLLPIFIAQFTLYIAFVAPSSFSLAIRVEAIDPTTKNIVLALALGIPGVIAIFLTPFVGVLSDRTRSRLGRRRPWLIFGGVLGIVGSSLIGLVPSAPVLIAGWTIAFLGYTFTSVMILAHFGDRLPESQRGKAMGINGAITQIAPLVGILAAGAFTSMPVLMFLVPGAAAFLGLVVFVATMKDPQLTHAVPPLRVGKLFEGFWFNPRRYPNLSWVWLSKALVFVALSFMQIYSVYLLSSRLGLDPAGVAGIVAVVGAGGIGAAILGAIGSGWLSDKLGTRKPFLVVSALTLAVGLFISGTMTSSTQYIIGSLIGTLAIGVYGAVDQALSLDVLPKAEDQNGRFLSTLGLANQIPQAIGPFFAAAVLTAFGGDYMWVYIAAAVFAALGALAILPISIGKRAELSTTSTQVMR